MAGELRNGRGEAGARRRRKSVQTNQGIDYNQPTIAPNSKYLASPQTRNHYEILWFRVRNQS